jgi:Pyruvate/2-oxoacid:ferredoxin oxidoreductase gamma subunit
VTYPVPKIAESIQLNVAIAEADFSLAMAPQVLYRFSSSTACWIKQGKALLLTAVTKANFADTDYFTLAVDGITKVFEIDKAGDGLTAAGVNAGRIAIDISADTTAAQCATRIRTALLAAFTSYLSITDNADGTLTLLATRQMSAPADNVANAGFSIAASTLLAASAASGSMFVAAGEVIMLDGRDGQTLSVIRDTADGKASLTPLRFVR